MTIAELALLQEIRTFFEETLTKEQHCKIDDSRGVQYYMPSDEVRLLMKAIDEVQFSHDIKTAIEPRPE